MARAGYKKKITDRLFLKANDGTMSRWNQNSELLQEREGSKYVVTLLVTERNKWKYTLRASSTLSGLNLLEVMK